MIRAKPLVTTAKHLSICEAHRTTSYYNTNMWPDGARCLRRARYMVGERKLCTVHASVYALTLLIQENEVNQ